MWSGVYSLDLLLGPIVLLTRGDVQQLDAVAKLKLVVRLSIWGNLADGMDREEPKPHCCVK